MSELVPSAEAPGLHVAKPSTDRPATAYAVCHCGAALTARGDDEVRALARQYTAHQQSHQESFR